MRGNSHSYRNTDQNAGYRGLVKKNYKHESVNHSAGEYIKDQAHTKGVVLVYDEAWLAFYAIP